MKHKSTPFTSLLITIVIGNSIIKGEQIDALENPLLLHSVNDSQAMQRVKRSSVPQKGFFFPIAMYTVRHHKPAQERGQDVHPETWEYRGQYFYGYRPKKVSSKKRAARLLAAGLPLLLAPLLSIIFSFPVLVPITQMTQMSGGTLFNPLLGKKRRKRGAGLHQGKPTNSIQDSVKAAKLKELQVVANYLHKVDYNENQQSRVMVNYLQCNGLLGTDDHCLERLSCEFSDPANADAPELEKTVTSILLGHILNNEFIPNPFIRRLKSSAVFGKNNSGKCVKYYCSYVDDNWDYTSTYPSSNVNKSPPSKSNNKPYMPNPRKHRNSGRYPPHLPNDIQRL